MGAGQLELEAAVGSMHRVAPTRQSVVTGLWFGFDASQLYLRVDFSRRAQDLLADKGAVELTFLTPADLRVRVRAEGVRTVASFERRLTPGAWTPMPAGDASAAAGQILELSLPWRALGVEAGGRLACFVACSRTATNSSAIPRINRWSWSSRAPTSARTTGRSDRPSVAQSTFSGLRVASATRSLVRWPAVR